MFSTNLIFGNTLKDTLYTTLFLFSLGSTLQYTPTLLLAEELPNESLIQENEQALNANPNPPPDKPFGQITEGLKVGAFIDSYYSIDLNPGSTKSRDYLTQPIRDREPNINLGMLEVKLDTNRWRGRLAGQVGSSVETNYASEPEKGWKYLQEAVVGYKINDKLWLDAGLYFSHIGIESFISKDNWAYTRLLASEFSPYYQTGAKVSYAYSEDLSLQLHILNGWQNISDLNGRTAAGTQVSWNISPEMSLTYNTFIGKELAGARIFNDFVFKYKFTDSFEVGSFFDFGNQEQNSTQTISAIENNNPAEVRSRHTNSQWYTTGLLAKYQILPKLSLVGRTEAYFDKDNVIVSTLSEKPYRVFSYSIGANYEPISNLLLRTEFRQFFSDEAIYQKNSETSFSKRDSFLVFSVGYSF